MLWREKIEEAGDVSIEEASPLQREAAKAHRERLARLGAGPMARPKPVATVPPAMSSPPPAPPPALPAPVKVSGELEVVVEEPVDRSRYTMAAMVKRVMCREYNIPLSVLLDRSHKPRQALIRFIAMYILKVDYGYSMPEIGRFFSDRDHTTVLHGMRRIVKRLDVEVGFCLVMDRLRYLVRQEAEKNGA